VIARHLVIGPAGNFGTDGPMYRSPDHPMVRFVRIALVLRPAFITVILLLGLSAAQQPEKKPEPSQPQQPQQGQSQPGQPQVKVHYLNVCAPPAEEQAEIKAAFARVSAKPAFSRDFEVSRGRLTLQDFEDSKFVRLRRDMAPESPLRMRDPKQFHELSLEDRVSSTAAAPSAVLGVDTPVSRIRLERFSKNSIVLARCPDGDQSAYEPLFRQASEIMAQYRRALGLRSAFQSDIYWLSSGEAKKAAVSGSAQKKAGIAKKK
jgi:hypothetical protein